jgi:hypothetical protein
MSTLQNYRKEEAYQARQKDRHLAIISTKQINVRKAFEIYRITAQEIIKMNSERSHVSEITLLNDIIIYEDEEVKFRLFALIEAYLEI